MMTSADVLAVLDALQRADVKVWVDGGWGVDALLGEQTREHNDLDLAIPIEHDAACRAILEQLRYRFDSEVGNNYVYRDEQARTVDVHLVDFNTTNIENGVEVYGAIAYHVGSLNGTGTIAGRAVNCVTPEALVIYHTGYELDDDDYHDVKALCDRFGIALPPPYDEWPSTPR